MDLQDDQVEPVDELGRIRGRWSETVGVVGSVLVSMSAMA